MRVNIVWDQATDTASELISLLDALDGMPGIEISINKPGEVKYTPNWASPYILTNTSNEPIGGIWAEEKQ